MRTDTFIGWQEVIHNHIRERCLCTCVRMCTNGATLRDTLTFILCHWILCVLPWPQHVSNVAIFFLIVCYFLPLFSQHLKKTKYISIRFRWISWDMRSRFFSLSIAMIFFHIPICQIVDSDLCWIEFDNCTAQYNLVCLSSTCMKMFGAIQQAWVSMNVFHVRLIPSETHSLDPIRTLNKLHINMISESEIRNSQSQYFIFSTAHPMTQKYSI